MSDVAKPGTFVRIFAGSGANAIGKVWVTLIQIVSVPVLVTAWGAEVYGLWLMLSVMPSYILLSDLGFGTAGAVDMTHRFARGDFDGALRAFQSIWMLVSAVSLGLFAFAGLAGLVTLAFDLFHVSAASDLVVTGVLLFFYSLATLQTSLVYMAFKSVGRYAQGTVLLDLLVPVEALFVMAAATFGYGLIGASASLFIVRSVGLFAYYVMLRAKTPWVRWGWSHASAHEIRQLMKPALAALLLPLSGALSLQGATFVIGVVVSPAAVAVFSATRILTRFPLQVASILARATLPELTISQAQGATKKFDVLALTNIYFAVAVTTPAAVLIIFFGDIFLHILSKGHLVASIGLFVVLSASMVLQTYWNAIAIPLIALNLQHRFVQYSLLFSMASLAFFTVMLHYWNLSSAFVVFVAFDFLLCTVVTRTWLRETGFSLPRFRAATDEIGRLIALFGTRLLKASLTGRR